MILAVSAVVAEQAPVEVQRVIDNYLSGNDPFSASFNGDAVSMGFEAGTKLSDLKAGAPFLLHAFKIDSLQNIDENAPIGSLLKPLNEWAVPLLKNGKARILLVVSKNSMKPYWHVGRLGCTGFAIEWEKVCKAWPESAGYHPIFIGNLIGPEFFHVPEMGDYNLSYLTHATNHPDSLYKYLKSSKTVLKELKSQWQLNFNKINDKI